MAKEVIDTIFPDIKIILQIPKIPENFTKVTLRGYPVNASTMERIEGIKDTTHSLKNYELLEIAKRQLTAAVMVKLREKRKSTRSPKQKREEISEYRRRVAEMKVSGVRIYSKWAVSTQIMSIAYYESHFIPFVELHLGEDTINNIEIEKFRQLVIEKTMKHKRSKKQPGQVENTVNSAFARALIIHNYICDTYPGLNLPHFSFHHLRTKVIQQEQVKYLPPAVRRELIDALEERVEKEPDYVFAAVVMYDTGARTAEACAVLPNEIEYNDIFTEIGILWQIVNGTRTEILKTDSAYRLVLVTTWGNYMLQRCAEALHRVY